MISIREFQRYGIYGVVADICYPSVPYVNFRKLTTFVQMEPVQTLFCVKEMTLTIITL
jgi:hypothetical protein